MAEPIDEQREAELVAYLDGELDAKTARDLETKLENDPVLRQRADTLRRTWELLDFLPQPEPSATFTSRTLDKLTVLRPATPPATAALTSTPLPTARSLTETALPKDSLEHTRRRRTMVAIAALLVFAAGYWAPSLLLDRGPRPLSPAESEEQMAKDLRVLDNLSLYRYGDDLSFLYNLDHQDLFGEEPSGR